MRPGLLALTLVSIGAGSLAAPRARAAETVEQRFSGSLAALAAPDPIERVLALWEASALAPLVVDGLTRLGRVTVGLARAERDPLIKSELLLSNATRGTIAGDIALDGFVAAGVPPFGLVEGPFAGASGTSDVGKHGPTTWRRFSLGATPTIPLGDYMPSTGDAHVKVGFAFESAEVDAHIVLGTNGPFAASLDGKPLTSWEGERVLTDWQQHVPVRLARGLHWLELTVGHRSVAPELALRVIPRVGQLRYVALDTPPTAPPAGWAPIAAREPAMRSLLARTKSPLQAARLGVWVEDTPPSERQSARRVEALLAQGGSLPTATRAELDYLLGRAERTDTSRAIAAFEEADRLAGGHAQALAALLDLAEKSDLPARADALARRLAAVDPAHPAVLAHAALRRFELADAAAALPLLPARPRLGSHGNARLLSLEATIAERAGHLERAAFAYRDLALAQLGASEPLQRAASLLSRAGKASEALAVIETGLRLRPMAAELHIVKARTRVAAGEDPGLVAQDLDALRAFHHQSPHFEEMRGRLLLLAGERGRAIEAFDRALELAPQDRDLADYRSALVAERGLADRWAEPSARLLESAATTPRGSEGGVYLLERTVNEVYASGLSSQFRQLALRIDQEATAQRFEDMAFAYTPGEDRLEVLEAEILRQTPSGWTRIRPQQIGDQRQQGKSEGVYTLTAYKVVRFPALAVGDVVHVQLRKDEIGSRNMFGDFFGVFFPISADLPKVRVEAIVVAPSSRRLHWSVAGLAAPVVTEADGAQQLVFSADDVPALMIEPSMPGYGDIARWVSISTFESWESLGRWYRQLVLPQLEVPPDLQATARGLVSGLTALEDKVAAIHRWVVTTTRYVGIEFGIHGFKPYKVAEVVQRGYGDCKDKAALLVAMLRAVGVPADFVLTRTRDLGTLDGTPATLWAFNHAIAYVPDLDLYLDGTAESSGLRELPELDQDALVLRLDLFSDAAPTLTRIPVQPPAENRVVASARFVLSPSGDAVADLSESIAGTSAGRLRARLQDPTRRDALIAEIIASQHPGSALGSASYENLDALGKPVAIRARVTLPAIASRSGDALVLPLVLEPGARLLAMAPLATRRQPLVLTQTELEENTDRYVLPPGAHVSELPPPVALTSPFGSFTMKVSRDGDEIISESRWEITTTRIAPTDYPAFRGFLEAVSRAETARLTITLPP